MEDSPCQHPNLAVALVFKRMGDNIIYEELRCPDCGYIEKTPFVPPKDDPTRIVR